MKTNRRTYTENFIPTSRPSPWPAIATLALAVAIGVMLAWRG